MQVRLVRVFVGFVLLVSVLAVAEAQAAVPIFNNPPVFPVKGFTLGR